MPSTIRDRSKNASFVALYGTAKQGKSLAAMMGTRLMNDADELTLSAKRSVFIQTVNDCAGPLAAIEKWQDCEYAASLLSRSIVPALCEFCKSSSQLRKAFAKLLRLAIEHVPGDWRAKFKASLRTAVLTKLPENMRRWHAIP